MKYYKAFDRDLKCRGFQYKEGKTYEIEGDPILCENGFHFCKDLVLTTEYYPCNDITDNLYAEVEILGDVLFEEPTKHKGVTNKIRIKKVLSDKEVLSLVGLHNSGHRNSGDRNSGNSNSGHGNSGHSNSGHWNSGNRNSGSWNSGNSNSGDGNSGHSNSGHRNSGDRNSGNCNSGHGNSGLSNSGSWNSGNSNSGNLNSGNCNSGSWNSGHGNSGHSNSGNSNSGSWNSGNSNSGNFNTITPEKIMVFNKYISRKKWDKAYKPMFLYFPVNPGQDYKEAFINSWNVADKEDREKVRDLPGFDADVFFSISGIDLR